jgi:hypothetical protein
MHPDIGDPGTATGMGGTTTVTGTAGTKLNTTDVVGSAQMRSHQAVLIPKREVDIDHSKHACKLGCEGIVSKRLGSLYRSGRSPRSRSRTRQPRRSNAKRKRTGTTSDGAAGGNRTSQKQSGVLTMSFFAKPLTMILALVVVVALVILLQIAFR